MSNYELAPQWDNLLLNLGIWQGSFTKISPQGEIQTDTPSKLTLESLDDNRIVKLVLERFPQDKEKTPAPLVQTYHGLNRSILFFNNGAFSMGAMQFSPFSEFGAEFSFIQGDRRLRFVQLFDKHRTLDNITLIREFREHSNAAERPPLTVDRLLGDWVGEAVTIYPDWRSPDISPVSLSLRRQGNTLSQHLTAGNFDFSSTGEIQGSRLLFNQETSPIQILLLPDGASCNTPVTIPKGEGFFLEVGWLIDDGLRQRLIRRYDARGGWESLTLVTERKVS